MQSGLIYILQSLVDLYLIAFVLRLAMQWVRADFRNPIVQFVLTVTNPLVLPLRQFIPPIYKIDTATLLVFLLLQLAATGILAQLGCAVGPDLLTLAGLAIIRGLRQILNVYFYVVFGYVLMSWISQGAYNPSLAMIGTVLKQIAEPVLTPVQKWIPPIGGLDLSPLFLLLALGAITRMLYSPAQQLAGGFLCPLGVIL
jgi:YggT family protein